MLLALELLLVGEFASGLQDAVLRAPVFGIRTDRLRRGRRASGSRRVAAAGDAACGARDLQAGREAFEIALLLGREIARHRFRRRARFGICRRHANGLAHSAGTCVGASAAGLADTADAGR